PHFKHNFQHDVDKRNTDQSPICIFFSEFNELFFNECIVITEFSLITVAGFTDTKCAASQTNANGIVGNCLLCHLTSARWPHHFFAIASWMISAFNRSSTYIFSSLVFSASSSLSRAINEVSIPPYLARHL